MHSSRVSPLLSLTLSALVLLPITHATPLPPAHHEQQQPITSEDFRIPTVHEAAYSARLLLLRETLATLSTVFPNSERTTTTTTTTAPPPPTDLTGYPIGLIDYYSDCSNPVPNSDSPPATSTPGNPTLLSLPIATTFTNLLHGSKLSLSIHSPIPKGIYSPASLPRLVLLGHIEFLPEGDDEKKHKEMVKECFLNRHPDAKWWLPGREGGAHKSMWAEMVVEQVYFVGGFGDRAYIGWIPVEVWRGVELKEEDVRRAVEGKD